MMTKEKLYLDFGERLRGLIEERARSTGVRLNQSELADAFGCKQAFVSYMINGLSLPSTDTAQQVARFFNVSIQWLLTGKGSKHIISDPGDEDIARITNALNKAKKFIDECDEVSHSDKLMIYSAICANVIGYQMTDEEIEKLIARLIKK